MQAIVAALARFPVYLTFDLDILDPAGFPGTGTPEAGGVSFPQLLQALLGLADSNLVGADVVELCPSSDHSDVSTLTAIKLLRELIIMAGK